MTTAFPTTIITASLMLLLVAGSSAAAEVETPRSVPVPDHVSVAALSGEQVVPAVASSAEGRFTLLIPPDGREAYLHYRLQGISATSVRIHCGRPGENGPAVVRVSPSLCAGTYDVRCTISAKDIARQAGCGPEGQPIENLASLAAAAADGLLYVNVTSQAHPGGVTRGQLQTRPPCGLQSTFCDICGILSCECKWPNCNNCLQAP